MPWELTKYAGRLRPERKILATYQQLHSKINCCIFWPAFGCWALQTLVKICIFNGKKLKNKKIAAKFNKKKTGYLSLHQNAGWVFYSQFFCMFDHSRINNIKTKLNFFATKTQRIFAHNQIKKYFWLTFQWWNLLLCRAWCKPHAHHLWIQPHQDLFQQLLLQHLYRRQSHLHLNETRIGNTSFKEWPS